jgi:hypothetical protein
VPLKLIKVGSKKLTSIKLFFIAESRRILKIRRSRLIRIYYGYKSSPVLVKAALNLLVNRSSLRAIKLYKKLYI